jgi:glycogenin glucosyltransferase
VEELRQDLPEVSELTDACVSHLQLVLTDAYLPGAAVLAHSLRDGGTKKKLACLVLQDSLQASTIEELQSLYNYVIPIERIGNPNPANLYLMNRPDLLYTFTKIHLWRQTQFRKIIYIDADVVALRAPEELFDLPDNFAAAPDVGWPDAFNTGVMVLTPHEGDYNAMRGMASAGDSFDGGDQGLINQYYEHRPWKRISFTYNTTPSANYQYEPAYRYYKRDISMVHFIGSQKPWQRGRSDQGAPTAFQELLSRWWAVYDRHYTISAKDYIAGRRNKYAQHMHQSSGQAHQQHNTAYYATGYPVDTTRPAPPPGELPQDNHHAQHQAGTATPLMTEPGEPAENIDQGRVEPTPTVEQRRFSAPHMEWDATRGAPPIESRPEAANFPSQTYEFNNDPTPFRPPQSYPEPPKDMWYEVPAPPRKEPKLKPLFPWEEREVPKPKRRFLDEETPSPESESDDGRFMDELAVTDDKKDVPETPVIQLNDESPWVAFGQAKNAWDEVGGINDYVRALTAFQKNRGKVQVVHPQSPELEKQPTQTHILSPSNTPAPEDLIEAVRERRESLILTDFPSAVERPSLPVTPAPRRRPTFWGDERDTGGDLPGADGVPDQADWDPTRQLEELRRNSLIGPNDLKLPDRQLSNREMPSTAVPVIPEEVLNQPHVPIANAIAGSSGDQPPKNTLAEVKAPTSGGTSPALDVPSSTLVSAFREVKSPTNVPSFGNHDDAKLPKDMSDTEVNTTLNATLTAGQSVGMPGAFPGDAAKASSPTGRPGVSFANPGFDKPPADEVASKANEEVLSPTEKLKA